ncbi:hypothetical protein ACH429_03625 [Streptomyces pathocidini]|uniref:Uncharacterized protein n=1 Tax=Streptomyces pathocidini TaxID=1650571 RepID=A0ABW7UKN2_9ACTN|nr:hypothetical protein [Streptomyces pathocidini]
MEVLAPALEGRVEVGEGVMCCSICEDDFDVLRGVAILSAMPCVVIHLRQVDTGGVFGEVLGVGHSHSVGPQFLSIRFSSVVLPVEGAEPPDTDGPLGHHRVGFPSGSGVPGRPGGTAAVASWCQVS